eukprot:5452765-Pleurochrysis_carterae.AAC.1
MAAVAAAVGADAAATMDLSSRWTWPFAPSCAHVHAGGLCWDEGLCVSWKGVLYVPCAPHLKEQRNQSIANPQVTPMLQRSWAAPALSR